MCFDCIVLFYDCDGFGSGGIKVMVVIVVVVSWLGCFRIKTKGLCSKRQLHKLADGVKSCS